jgi:16S rRNA (adenine1518-N6/adenine1519-N6)-dimethyltransferase
MLFRLFLEHTRQPSTIVFLVQKEVAEHIAAKNGKEGILSLSVKVYGDPKYIAKVSREAFTPKPRVDSAIIAIMNISRTRLGDLSDEIYFRVVKTGLGLKRKMLLGNLARGLKIPKELLLDIFNKLDLDEHIRGEDVTVEKWLALTKEIQLTREI